MFRIHKWKQTDYKEIKHKNLVCVSNDLGLFYIIFPGGVLLTVGSY